MDGISDPILSDFVRCYLPRLQSAYLPDLVLAFGSRARGDALDDSDLDLIVVSKAFQRLPFLDRAIDVLRTVSAPFGIDVLCYTPEEFDRKRQELGVVSQAVEEGLVLGAD